MFNTTENFYDILKASPNATFEELKSNYKRLILQCHPDKLLQQQSSSSHLVQHENTDKLENDLNNHEFVAITEAWNCLKDPLKRKRYDAELLLNKFHTHSNIYAHIQLKEMKKCLTTDVELERDYDGEEQGMESDSGAPSYIYTYGCRCGGQYVVDESAEQYCRSKVNRTVTADDGNVSVDDDADKRQNNNTYIAAGVNHRKSNDGGVGGGGDGSSIVGTGNQEGVVFTEDEEGGGELIVECSECSLVIILNG